jgi:hypothetical protein
LPGALNEIEFGRLPELNSKCVNALENFLFQEDL